ncbi:MAG: AlpA family phage regulatory protein [Phycisphaerae bacterium]|nr:AlpA family phage regulatory protein [Fodinibius sp.]NIU58783.1 AlpA family phage regulatory protein [Phycisphaerae bacterium]NIV16227.1 AlpA family phage regulatory protein [Fodinibius sp.]NIW95056.1 AlpA family phage regulatory protein [Phycisphaerae bacterium]NIY30199.1 AlpA family phage regulatory protein [Fodinibius sp.]
MQSDNDLKAVCSVADLARKLGLSRARFYQLMEKGVFPKPVYCTRTRRPFYTLDLQQKSIDARKTGIGHNGQLVVFYSARQNKFRKSQDSPDYRYEELTAILRQMGLNITCNKVKNAVKALYPEELTQHTIDGAIIRDLFKHFNQGL